MILGVEPEEAGAHGRTAGEIERDLRLARRLVPRGGLAIGGGERGEVVDREAGAGGLVNHGDGLASVGAEGAAEDLVAEDDLVERAAERGGVEAPEEAEGEGHDVGGVAGLELVEEPKALLREGEGEIARAIDGRERRRLLAAIACQRGLDDLGEPGDGGGLEEGAQREVHAEGVADARGGLGGDERVAAQLEEAVVRAGPLRREVGAPRRRSRRSPPRSDRARRTYARSRVARASGTAAAARARSTLPLGVSGSASSTHEELPARGARAASPRGTRGAPIRARRRIRRRDEVGDEPAAAPARPRGPAPRPRARPGCSPSSAASISPGSTRWPRIFTWVSARPRNSRSPPGEKRATSPVLYMRAPGSSAKGSGRKRSAVRSGRAR